MSRATAGGRPFVGEEGCLDGVRADWRAADRIVPGVSHLRTRSRASKVLSSDCHVENAHRQAERLAWQGVL